MYGSIHRQLLEYTLQVHTAVCTHTSVRGAISHTIISRNIAKIESIFSLMKQAHMLHGKRARHLLLPPPRAVRLHLMLAEHGTVASVPLHLNPIHELLAVDGAKGVWLASVPTHVITRLASKFSVHARGDVGTP